MKTKQKVECPQCGLIVQLNTNRTMEQHKPRWNTMRQPMCFASGKTVRAVKQRIKRFNDLTI